MAKNNFLAEVTFKDLMVNIENWDRINYNLNSLKPSFEDSQKVFLP